MSEIKGSIRPREKIIGSIVGQRVYPELEDLVITPTMQEQKFKSKKYGYDDITVKAIKSETLNITPNTQVQTYKGLYNKVTVGSIDITTLDDYKICLNLSKQILGGA